jgi:rhodanese-related sulfurtransferase
MKKFLVLLAAFALVISLAACGSDCPECEELAELPEVVDMSNVDEFLGRPDVQYVDLRNFDDKMSSGYISGFEMIPFFDYLEATNTLVRTNGWTFEAAGVVNQSALEGLFNADKAIFLMCGSGTRAGFVKEALESLGYENVYNVGGIADYAGDNKVFGDGTYNVEVQLPLPAEVTMDNVDMYLGRNDVQYVDLRNFDDKMASGYIAGFEFIPFFDYLEYSDILVRSNGWTFEAAAIVNQAALEGLFDMDKTIFLMCGSGTRAGFVKEALESLGYTKVYNVGGIASYAGDNKVFGDGEYNLTVPAVGPYTPGVYFGYDDSTGYTVSITIGANGAIEDVLFDAVYHGTTKNTLDTAYTLGSGITWKQEAEWLADFLLANQGWDGITLDITDISGENGLTMPRHFIYIDAANSPDDVAGVSIGAEGFVLAWNMAIELAGGTGVAGVPTSAEVLALKATNVVDYADGQYYGYEAGYSALITVEDGFIVDVFLDAIHCRDLTDPADGIKETCNTKRSYTMEEYTMNLEVNDNGTPLDDTDDFYQVVDGKLSWWQQADALAEAVVDAQQWDPSWVIVDGDFDLTDTDTADAVGGVSIGIDSWMTAIEEALDAAEVPAS